MNKKRIVIIALICALLAGLSAGLYYINKEVLPALAKEKIVTGLSALTSGKVTVDSVRFSIWRGLVISDLIIFDKDNPEVKLLHCRDASARFFLFGVLRDKKIIIPSLKLNSLGINIIRKNDGSFNIDHLIGQFQKGPSTGAAPAILIKSVRLTKGIIRFQDFALQTPVSAELRIDQLSANASWKKVSLEATALIIKDKDQVPLRIHADYTFAPSSLNMDASFEKADLMTFKEYLTGLSVAPGTCQLQNIKAGLLLNETTLKARAETAFQALTLHKDGYNVKDAEGNVDVLMESPRSNIRNAVYQGKIGLRKASLSYDGDLKADASLLDSTCAYIVKPETATVSIQAKAVTVDVQKDGITTQDANIETDTTLVFSRVQTENRLSFSCEGKAHIQTNEVLGIPRLGTVTGLDTTVRFKNNDYLIDTLQANILDTPVTAQGSVKENILELDAVGDFDLEKLSAVLPKELGLPAFAISGTTEATTHISCDLTKQEVPVFSGEATLQNVDLTLAQQNIALETDTGRVKFDTKTENIQWHFEAVKYANNIYSFDGTLKGFQAPEINAVVIGPDIKVQADLTKTKGPLKVSSLKGRYKNTSFDLSGEWDTKQDLTCQGNITLELEDLKHFLPQYQGALKPIDPQGIVFLRGDITGPIADPRLWKIKSHATSDAVKAYGLKFHNVELDYTQIGREGFLNLLSFNAYRGKGAVKGRLDIGEKDLQYRLRAILEGVDLNALKLDTTMKEKTFFGILGLDASLNGTAGDPKSLRGDGALAIKNGNLWEFNPLKGLGDFLFIPRFSSITFTQAEGDFTIRDGYIYTDNFELQGTELGLIAEGKISLEGELDLLVNSQINMPGPKIADQISRAANLTAIKITGTVKDPKYQLQPIAQNIMKKLGDIFSNITP